MFKRESSGPRGSRGVGRGLALLLCLLGIAWGSRAAALEAQKVPAPLQPWLPWVLEQLGDSVCPRLGEQAACVWPGRLELQLDEAGGHFRLNVQLDRRGAVALPGGAKQWPQQVEADGGAVVVLEQEAAPVATLAAGQHLLE